MNLGTFSVSLNVQNIEASKQFYESIGFTVFHGDISQKWIIMKNDTATIGLFQGMFEKNILTFNPGWNAEAETLTNFTDVRQIQEAFKNKGLSLIREVSKENKLGPGSITLIDPDGNPILIDQHV